MTSSDRKRAAAFVRHRAGGERPATDPFVVDALQCLDARAEEPLGSIPAILDGIRESAAGLAAQAARVDQHPDRGMAGPLPLSLAMRLPVELEEIVSLAAIVHRRTSALVEELTKASAQNAHGMGRAS